MGIFQQFPYSNFHDMNMDQLIKIVREMLDEWVEYKAKLDILYSDITTAFEDFKAEFDEFIASIDVPAEFDAALNRLILSGQFTQIISPICVQTATNVTTAWLNDHITQPTTPAIDSSLTIAGAAADAKAAGDGIRGLLEQVIVNDAYDVMEVLVPNKTVTMHGITFADNNNGTCTFRGTATGTSFVRYFLGSSSFPDHVSPGKTYFVKNTGSKVNLQIAAYFNNTTSDYEYIFNDSCSGLVTIPDNATGMMIRNVIYNGMTVNETIEIPKLLSAPQNMKMMQLLDCNAVDLLEPYTHTPTITMNGVTLTRNNGVYVLSGTATGASIIRYFAGSSAFPEGVKAGQKYYAIFNGTNVELQIAVYYNNDLNDYEWIYTPSDNGEIIVPANATGMIVRLFIRNGVTINETVKVPMLLTAPSNEVLWNNVQEMASSGYVNLIKSDQYYVRSEYDETRDAVYAFKYPETLYNYTFNFRDVKLINKSVPARDTVQAYQNASLYKNMRDDIPAFTINGAIVGSNHGNPNFIKCECSHNLTVNDIGTVWSDGTYNYTVVQVFAEYIIVGTLDSNGQLVVRTPHTLSRSGVSLTITDSAAHQLRRSAINRSLKIINDSGAEISNQGSGKYIRCLEKYDICDQSKMLSFLEANAGTCTNDSYYEDSIPYKLATVENIFEFNANATVTIYGTLTAQEAITVNTLYGAMSMDFHSDGAGSDYGFVPKSAEFTTPTALDYSTNMYIHPSSAGVPDRFYQLSSTGAGKGAFLHLIDGLGDCDPNVRETLNPFAWFSGSAEKLYLHVLQNEALANGKSLSWAYGKGIFKKTSNQVTNTCFRLHDACIVSMDWSSAFNGYADVPEILAGGEIEVLDKSSSVTVHESYVGNKGIKITCTGTGYAVLKIK